MLLITTLKTVQDRLRLILQTSVLTISSKEDNLFYISAKALKLWTPLPVTMTDNGVFYMLAFSITH